MSSDDEDADVAVIGAGVAGAIIAEKLALRGLRVVVLEAGSDGEDRASLVRAFAMATQKSPRSPYSDVDVSSPVASPEGEGDYEQGDSSFHFKSGYLRRVGGTTWHMLGNMPRHLPADFKMRSRYGVGVDWPIGYDDLEPWYGEAESELGVSGDHEEWDGLHGAHRSRPFPMTKIWPSYGDLYVAGAIGGLSIDGKALKLMSTPQSRNSRPYDGRPACAGNSSCVPICPIGAKYDGSVHVRKAIKAGADIRRQSVVDRIVLDPANLRVKSLHYLDWSSFPACQRRSMRAKIVVLAAHAVETPRLLLLSADPDCAPAGVANGSGEVGKNLMDHLQGQISCLVADPIFPFRGPLTTSGIDEFRDGEFRSEHAAFRMSLGNDGMARTESPVQTLRGLLDAGMLGAELTAALRENVSRHFRISYSTEQLPSASNCVTLSEKTDEFGLRLPKLTVGLDNYNRAAFAHAQRVIGMIFDRLGATKRVPPKDLDTYSGAGHIMGTTRMGSDAKTSVVDVDCRTHQHDNLYIVGASVFPTCGTANPTLTVAALALRAADEIGTKMQKGA
jgi:choline dehydrogenase-like flavoprotein